MGCIARLRNVWRRVETIANHRGQYSIERMCELSKYCQHTPLWRVFLVFLLSILPSLMTIVGLDSMPLQDPYAGWDKNSVMWVRVFVGTFVLSIGVMLQLRVMVPVLWLTTKQSLYISTYLAFVFVLTAMLIAKCWAFPIPFMMLLANPPWFLTLFASVGFVAGRQKLASNPEFKIQLQRFSKMVNFAALFLVIFPVYIAIFRSLNGINQFAFIFVLPVLKMVLKKVMKNILGDLEELVPVGVISVDIFNALFQAKCMQTAGSMWTTMGIISIDAVQNVYSLRKIFQYMDDAQRMVQHESGSVDLLAYCEALLRNPERLDLGTLRVRSLTLTPASREVDAILQTLSRLAPKLLHCKPDSGPEQRHPDTSIDRSFRGVGLNVVAPLPPARAMPGSKHEVLSSNAGSLPEKGALCLKTNQQAVVLRKALELLWKCESVLLVEYIETAVPLLYGVSISILYYLPNARYYPGMAEMSLTKLHSTIGSILVYSVLEFGSLIYLHAILKWRFQVSALHQLAFVLEKQWMSIQGLLLSWVIVVLSFTLVHYGNDFTFEFKWLHRAANLNT